jgi:hypothetical protein
LYSRRILEVRKMAHNMTVTVEDTLWDEMKKHNEIRWSAVMKEAAKEKLRALAILERLTKNAKFTEEEMEAISVKIGKEITKKK